MSRKELRIRLRALPIIRIDNEGGTRARDLIQPRAASSRLQLKPRVNSISELQRADQSLEQADMKSALR